MSHISVISFCIVSFMFLVLPRLLFKNYRDAILGGLAWIFFTLAFILLKFDMVVGSIIAAILAIVAPKFIVNLLLAWAIRHNRKVDSQMMVPLKHANALSSIMKTHKDAYKFSQDKESLIAFMIYTYLGGDDVKITDDMARLFEKQLRMKDLFLDIGLNADKTAMLPEEEHAKLQKQLDEEAKVFVWIPVIDVLESLSEGATCLDIKAPSITLAKSKFEDGVNFHNVIACPVNEYYTGSEFTKDQILIIEQDRYVNEVISYSHGNDELIISGKLLFTINQLESLPMSGDE